MSADVTIVIGTYGIWSQWSSLVDRAAESAMNQTSPAVEVTHCHGKTLARARNEGAAGAKTEWLIFLDADDELDAGYVEASFSGTGDIRQPLTLGIEPDGREDSFPVLTPSKPLMDGNYIVVGAMCRKDYFDQVGGFGEWPIWEDWALWLAMTKAGATVGTAPGAIYRVHINPKGRNNSYVADRNGELSIFDKIRRAHL